MYTFQIHPTYFDFHSSVNEPRATNSILKARTDVTKKNDRTLISYKLKHRTKEAMLILQSAIYIFRYPYLGQHSLFLYMWSSKKCIISTVTLSVSFPFLFLSFFSAYIFFFFLNSSEFHLNSFRKKHWEVDMYLLEIMIKESMVKSNQIKSNPLFRHVTPRSTKVLVKTCTCIQIRKLKIKKK